MNDEMFAEAVISNLIKYCAARATSPRAAEGGIMNRPYVLEQLEILRRIADRGLSLAVNNKQSYFTDLFQHFLNELALLEGDLRE